MIENYIPQLKANTVDQHTQISLHYIIPSQIYDEINCEETIQKVFDSLSKENYNVKLSTCLALDGKERFVGFAPIQGGKSGSLKFLSSKYKIPLEFCLTFGDSLNDADMLAISKGGSILVANSQKELLKWYEEKKDSSPWLEISKYNYASALSNKLIQILSE